MTLDLVVLGLAGVFALWGFFAGAARQLATVLAGMLGWLAAGPLGQFFGPVVSKHLATSALVGVVLATLASFVIVLITVQIVATLIIRRLLAGRDGSRTLDRLLGFTLGGAKMLAVAYVTLCAMSFLEQNVTILGRKLAFTPKDSQLMAFARQYNLLEQRQFSGAQDLLRVARFSKDPKGQQRLKDDNDFSALSKDPRFSRIINTPAMMKALETGDVRGLLSNNEVIELIQDPASLRRLERVGELAP